MEIVNPIHTRRTKGIQLPNLSSNADEEAKRCMTKKHGSQLQESGDSVKDVLQTGRCSSKVEACSLMALCATFFSIQSLLCNILTRRFSQWLVVFVYGIPGFVLTFCLCGRERRRDPAFLMLGKPSSYRWLFLPSWSFSSGDRSIQSYGGSYRAIH
jgi:hypothetical protein